MRKAHEFIPDSMYERIDNDHIDSESESSIRNMSPHQNGHSAEYMDLTSSDSMQRNASPLFVSILYFLFVKESIDQSSFFASFFKHIYILYVVIHAQRKTFCEKKHYLIQTNLSFR